MPPVHMLDSSAPSIHAIVPARNEADVVARAMASLAAQIYPGELRITLVDDHSDRWHRRPRR